MCVATCPHCRPAPFDQKLMRCDLCDTWSNILTPETRDVCLVASWAHAHGMMTTQEQCDMANGKGRQLPLWGAE